MSNVNEVKGIFVGLTCFISALYNISKNLEDDKPILDALGDGLVKACQDGAKVGNVIDTAVGMVDNVKDIIGQDDPVDGREIEQADSVIGLLTGPDE